MHILSERKGKRNGERRPCKVLKLVKIRWLAVAVHM
jgi:hypothetical protein